MNLLPFKDSDLPGLITFPLTLGLWLITGIAILAILSICIFMFFIGGEGVVDEFLDGLFGPVKS